MKMKEETRLLYELCFKDSPAFTELYFRERYSDERNIVLYADEQLVSSMQLIPYTLTFCGTERVAMNYISAACTHPDYRARGAMRPLLQETHRTMFAEGVMFATLIPAEE